MARAHEKVSMNAKSQFIVIETKDVEGICRRAMISRTSITSVERYYTGANRGGQEPIYQTLIAHMGTMTTIGTQRDGTSAELHSAIETVVRYGPGSKGFFLWEWAVDERHRSPPEKVTTAP